MLEKLLVKLSEQVNQLFHMLAALAEATAHRFENDAKLSSMAARAHAVAMMRIDGIMQALRVYGIDVDGYCPPQEIVNSIMDGTFASPFDIPDWKHPDYNADSPFNPKLVDEETKRNIEREATQAMRDMGYEVEDKDAHVADVIDLTSLLDNVDGMFNDITPEDIIGDDDEGGE